MVVPLIVVVLIASFLLTNVIRLDAIRRRLLDHPNERSSHTVPTPRGGGLAIVVTFIAGIGVLWLMGLLPASVFGALAIGGTLVAAVGYVDDRRSLSARTRFAVHGAASVIGVVLLGGMPPLWLGFITIEWGVMGHLVAVIGIMWMINLYNFMDGIDGIAGSEAVCVAVLGGALLFAVGTPAIAFAAWVLAAASLGFLAWNFPPARIFMGDAGSGFLGYVFAILAIAGAGAGVPLVAWLILLGVFVVDATITLVRRMLRGTSWAQAHRTHAYQHATTWARGHLPVTVTVILINLVWLALCAALAVGYPPISVPIAVAALVPLVGIAVVFKAGVEAAPSP